MESKSISEIDKNFKQLNVSFDDSLDYKNVLDEPFKIYGLTYNYDKKRFERLPSKDAQRVNQNIEHLAKHTSGGRVRFSTNSSSLTIAVKYSQFEPMSHMALVGNCGFSLCKNVGDKEIFVGSVRPEWNENLGFCKKILLNANELTNYTLYFPLYNGVDELYLGFDKNSTVGEGLKYRDIAPIVYYGSSITQGGCSSRPDTDYQALICKDNNVDFVNLGFSGNAKAEPTMVEYLSSLDCSIMVLDYDHNAPSVEYLKETHYKAYKEYRSKRPLTPIIFASRPDFYNDVNSLDRLKVIKRTYNLAKKLGDKNVYFIDGRSFFRDEWSICTVDGTHPTDLGFYKMANVFNRVINKILK